MTPPDQEPKSRNIPLVRVAIIKPVLLALRNQGHEISGILEKHGLSEAQLHEPRVFVRHDTVYAIFQEAATMARHDFCATIGQEMGWEQFFPLASQLKEANTLSDLITGFTAAVSKETNAVKMSLLVEGEHAYFAARRKFRPMVSPSQADAFQVAIWISLLHRVLDIRWDPIVVILRLSDPTTLPGEFHGIQAIKCDEQGFSIRFPASWLMYKLTPDSLDPKTTPDLNPDLTAPVDFLASVENVLRPHLADRDMDVATAARLCGYGVDTLNRRLSRYEVTLSGVLSKLRRLEAQRLLADENTRISEIAQHLGYSDATAFTRAFRNWTGQSPTEYRRS